MQTYPTQQTRTIGQAPNLSVPRSWQTLAIAAYHRSQPDEAELRRKLAAAVETLTRCAIDPDAIVVDLEGRAASIHVDEVHFRWANSQVFVLRPCAYCGLGTFTSAPVASAEALGFALDGWEPLHDDCRPFEADV